MTNTKRPRGRPAGSGKKDEALLGQVADLLVRAEAAGTKLTATMAMNQTLRTRKVTESSHESTVRRLQRKWREQREDLMVEARRRETDRNAPSRTIDVSLVRRATDVLLDSLNRPMSASQQLSAMISRNTSALQAVVNATRPKDPVAQLMRRTLEEQHMRDLVDPPSLRVIRELTSNLDKLTKRFRTPF